MPNEYLRLTDTELNIKQSENILARIEDKRKDSVERKEIQSESSLFAELYKAFKDFFSKLGKPTLQGRYQKKESPSYSSDYNDTMKEIHDDINVAYIEEDSLSSVMVKNFNYGEVERSSLLNKVRSLNSKSIDYSFYSTGAKDQSLFAIDSFTDNSKVDLDKTSPGIPTGDIVVNQGVVTLKRSGNINRSGLVSKVTGIQESIPEWDPSSQTGGYEGLYFGMKNEARPEGGKWHIQYASDGVTLHELGASEGELISNRLRMFDNNPDTFWEVEYLTKPIVGYKNKYSGEQISVPEFNSLVANEVGSPNVEVVGGTVVTDEHGKIISDYVPVSQGGTIDYLTVDITCYLEQAQNVNWISLNPNNFGRELYIDILSIQTSEDGKSFEELEGFDDHEYDITLTREANSELIPTLIKDTLSPDKFKYAGQGVWSFAPRKVKAIRFIIRQLRSYNKDYEVLMVETEQHITTTTTKKEWWGLVETTSTDHSIVKRTLEIPYLDGLVNGFDVLSLEPGSSDIDHRSWNFWPLGSSKNIETTIGPESISRQWTATRNDRSRFAIGIRDINIYSYLFAESSEIISKPYVSPKPISKLKLQVDEQVPKEFYSGTDLRGTENEWIKYYISVDNGASWNRIAPSHHRDTLSENGINNVPEIININSDVSKKDRFNSLAYIDTTEPVYSVRFKAFLSRPTNINSAESFTPVLSKYALQIYPFGGL